MELELELMVWETEGGNPNPVSTVPEETRQALAGPHTVRMGIFLTTQDIQDYAPLGNR